MANPCGVFNDTYAQDMAIVRTKTQWILVGISLVFFLACPLFISTSWLSVMNFIGITLVAVLGLQLLTGYTGQISLGHSAFVGVGAFASAVLATRAGLPFWICLPLAGIFAGLVGLIFGAPSLRVKGLYLALTTLAAQFILGWVFRHWGFLGGRSGMMAPAPSFFGFTVDTEQSYYYLVLVVALVMIYFAKNLTRTKTGRAFVAIRDNENAAEVMGINVFRYKLIAFFIGCFFAGIAGSLWAHYLGIVSHFHFTLLDSIWYLGMLVVGGLGSIMGAVFGVAFIKLLDQGVVLLSPMIPGLLEEQAGLIGALAFGLVVMLFLIFEPRGLYHRWELFKLRYRLLPFARV